MPRSTPTLESLLTELVAGQKRLEARMETLERALTQRVPSAQLSEEDDALYQDAREAVVAHQRAATSFLQRKLGIGYGRAARLMDLLESRGVIGPGRGAEPREILEQ